ncbi:MAG TPA: S41 family peptidase [Pyrinomonadaceae bacterium]|nr:S41 family peptidase [Pyrinomonadaceae bacterium]
MSKRSTYPNFLLLLLFTVFVVAPANANPLPSGSEVLSGRWHLSFELPNGYYRIPVEFVVMSDGRVDFAVLGRPDPLALSSGGGKLSGHKLSLNALSQFGKLKISATLNGDKLQGRWSPSGFFAKLFFKGELLGERDRGTISSASRVRVFDDVWEQIRTRFYDPRLNGIDWRETHLRYRPQVEAARSDAEFVGIIRRMLGQLHSSHLEFFAIPGNQSVWEPKQDAPRRTVTWRRQSSRVGYLKISGFDDDPRSRADIDRAFAELGQLPSLVIDLRGNRGGALGIAMRTGDHLFAKETPVGYFVNRAGLIQRGATSINQINLTSVPAYSGYDTKGLFKAVEENGGVLLKTGGQVPTIYQGRVALLVDEYTYSAAEAFAGVLKETRVATIVGRRTAGGMLGPELVSLANGWVVVIPVMDFRTARGTRLEGAGVDPDIVVTPRKGGDPELARAVEAITDNKQ